MSLWDWLRGRKPSTKITEVLVIIGVPMNRDGIEAGKAKTESLRQEVIRCDDCGKTFVLNDGLRFGLPPAHRVPSATEREKMEGYTIECPACHKDHFAGWRRG